MRLRSGSAPLNVTVYIISYWLRVHLQDWEVPSIPHQMMILSSFMLGGSSVSWHTDLNRNLSDPVLWRRGAETDQRCIWCILAVMRVEESKDHHQGHPGESGPYWWSCLKADSPMDAAHHWVPWAKTREDTSSPKKAHKSPRGLCKCSPGQRGGLGQMKQNLTYMATLMSPLCGVEKEMPSTLRTPSPLVVGIDGSGNLIKVKGTMSAEKLGRFSILTWIQLGIFGRSLISE